MTAPPAPTMLEPKQANVTMWARVRRLPWSFLVILVLLILVWAVPLVLSERTGLRLPVGYRVFYTAILLAAGLFFWFLDRERVPHPATPLGVLGSVALVYLTTVGSLVGLGVVLPQFAVPEAGDGTVAADPVARGKALFFGDAAGCFRCHTIAGTGGTRGPDLTAVRERAGGRVPGMTAEAYLREKIRSGATYAYKVPDYVPIMPPFAQILTEEEVLDLVQYLLSQK